MDGLTVVSRDRNDYHKTDEPIQQLVEDSVDS